MSPNLKRFVLVFAALALMLPVIAACNGDDDGDDAADTDDTEEVEDEETTEEEEATEEEEETEEATEEETDEATEEEEETEEATEEETEEATEEETEAEEDGEAADGDGETIQIGLIEWAEGISVTYLWAELLEQEGYDVEITTLQVAGLYTGLAQGDLDVFLDAWLPNTHEQYWNAYGDQLEEVGTWYEEAILALTVPQYVADEGVTSLADLSDNADMFDSTITGIDPGAGMMGIAADEVMPTYGLDDWTLSESSEAGMLSELESATSNEEPIVVTLWQPHWAYSAYDLHNLEDPEMAWGEPDSLQILGREGFSEDFPQVAEWLGNFSMETDQIGELMNYVTVEAEPGDERAAAAQWLEDGGQEAADEWITSGE